MSVNGRYRGVVFEREGGFEEAMHAGKPRSVGLSQSRPPLRGMKVRLWVKHARFCGAAITGKTGKVRYNLGEAPFAHAPPDEGFEAFCVAAAR
jgi:hypothetical protein